MSNQEFEFRPDFHPKLSFALEKACGDHFDYLAKLTDGSIIYFREATYDPNRPDWIHLKCIELDNSKIERAQDVFIPERGIDVRVDQIVWCIDAPGGS